MSEANSGFIYLWYDRKHKRYYIGSHWGSPDDGYICSSRWMRKAYRRRPQDFKRRIIKTITTDRASLYTEETRYLLMIKDHEIHQGPNSRYYNLNRNAQHWSADPEKIESLREKLSRAGRQPKPPRTEEHRRNLSLSQKGKPRKKHTEEHKQYMSKIMKGRTLQHSPEWHEKQRLNGLAKRGKPGWKWTEEQKRISSEKQKGRPKNPESIAKMKATKARQYAEKMARLNTPV